MRCYNFKHYFKTWQNGFRYGNKYKQMQCYICKYKYSLIAGTGVKMKKMDVKNTVRRCYSLINNTSERRINLNKNANKHIKQFKIFVHY